MRSASTSAASWMLRWKERCAGSGGSNAWARLVALVGRVTGWGWGTGEGRSRRGRACLVVCGVLPPFAAGDVRPAFEGLLRFEDGVVQETQLAGNEGGGAGVAGEGAGVDDVEGLGGEGLGGEELGEGERGAQVEGVGGVAGVGEGGQPEVDVLLGVGWGLGGELGG